MDYNEIKRRYGKIASWAIWDDCDMNDTEIIEKNIDQLKPKIIIVGLNISKNLSKDWENFHKSHKGGHDRKLRKLFNHSSLRGVYMTDFIKGVE